MSNVHFLGKTGLIEAVGKKILLANYTAEKKKKLIFNVPCFFINNWLNRHTTDSLIINEWCVIVNFTQYFIRIKFVL